MIFSRAVIATSLVFLTTFFTTFLAVDFFVDTVGFFFVAIIFLY